jgi:hypothetical protein
LLSPPKTPEEANEAAAAAGGHSKEGGLTTCRAFTVRIKSPPNIGACMLFTAKDLAGRFVSAVALACVRCDVLAVSCPHTQAELCLS